MLLWRVARGRPRLIIATLVGLALYPLLPAGLVPRTRGLLAWDVGCLLFLGLSATLFSGERRMAFDAARQEEGEWTVFFIVIGATIASFVAIVGEFSIGKDVPADVRDLRVGLVAATLLLSWLVTQTLFALRYAHEYYSTSPPGPAGEPDKGLDFPGDAPPDYWDFFYFSLVLGMTFQVSDVQITSRKLRRLAAAQGLLSFLFNTVILALTVNIAAGLIGS
jgi:uncharacterized membrane protein